MTSLALAFDVLARDRASSTFDKVGNSAEKSGGKLKAFGKAGAAGVVAAGAAAITAGTYFFNTGAKLQQMGMKAETVFGKQLGTVDKWAKANANAMGLTRREATGLAANFGDLLIPMGFTRKAAAKMSTDVVGLSGALSQWSGGTKSAAEVTDILSAAMLGETDGLKSLGIAISAADIEARLLAKGQDKLTGAARQQAEAQAIQQLIMEKSTDAQAAFAKGGSPLLSAQAKIKAKMGEVRDTIAVGLLPILSDLAVFVVDKVIPAASKMGAMLSEKLGPIISKLGTWFREDLLPPLKELGEQVLVHARDMFDAFKDALGDARPFLDLLGKAIVNVVVPGLKKLLEVVGPILADRIRLIGKALGAIGDTGKWMWNNVLQPVFVLLAKALAMIMSNWATMLAAMGKVPGFGWAKDAAEKLRGASDKALGLADNLKKIKDPKLKVSADTTPAHNSLTAFLQRVQKVSGQTLTIYGNMVTSPKPTPSSPGIFPHNALGTPFWRGGLTWVGETGRELLNIPRGAEIVPNAKAEDLATGGHTVHNHFPASNEAAAQAAAARFLTAIGV